MRIFLRDGTTLASYGEYARVNGRVVFSLPLGQVNGQPRLQLVTSTPVRWTGPDRSVSRSRASRPDTSRLKAKAISR